MLRCRTYSIRHATATLTVVNISDKRCRSGSSSKLIEIILSFYILRSKFDVKESGKKMIFICFYTFIEHITSYEQFIKNYNNE